MALSGANQLTKKTNYMNDLCLALDSNPSRATRMPSSLDINTIEQEPIGAMRHSDASEN